MFACVVCRTGRQKRRTQLRDHIPVENLAAMSLQQNSLPSLDQRLNGKAAAGMAVPGNKQENDIQPKLPEKVPSQSRNGQKTKSSAMSDESGGGRSQRTSDKSSRSKDSRYAGVVAKKVRGKPIAGSVSGRKSEITQRPIRKETPQAAVDHPSGPLVSRIIYTSDRRTGSAGDSTGERLSSSNTAVSTIVTGWLVYLHLITNNMNCSNINSQHEICDSLVYWRHQLWGTGARAPPSTSNCLIFLVTS